MTEDHYLREQIRQTLATDPHLGILNVRIQIEGKRLILYGEVASLEKGEYARTVIQRQLPDFEIISELSPPIPSEGPPPEGPYVRIAAAGDLHYDELSHGKLRAHFQKLETEADLLLLAGDLTDTGTAEQARVLAEDLKGLHLPIVAVLGNHDYHCNQSEEVGQILEEIGVTILEGNTRVLQCRGLSVGIAGTKGFCGGFEGACGTVFGEREMKDFISHTEMLAERLKELLLSLETDVKIALLHYAPIRETLLGERAEVFPFLGSFLFGKAIDEGKADLAIHGHAHHGRERGMTRGGIPVRNAAIPMLKKANLFYALSPRAKTAQSNPQK
ncbi:MAG: metallophosphoesterase [Nitrospirae bacterium]|nr:metallophosphoesterase [Candidatus Manganitrophaceae bacterium]